MNGTVYLIHFESAFQHARHYIGFSTNLEGRLWHHRNGTGSRLLRFVNEADIKWYLVRTWEGDREFERYLKGRKKSPLFCPVCRVINESGPKAKFNCKRCLRKHFVYSNAGKEHYLYIY